MEDLGQKTIADVTAAGLALAKGDAEAAEEVISGEMRSAAFVRQSRTRALTSCLCSSPSSLTICATFPGRFAW